MIFLFILISITEGASQIAFLRAIYVGEIILWLQQLLLDTHQLIKG